MDRWIKEQFSREWHVVCNEKTTRRLSEKGLLSVFFYKLYCCQGDLISR